MLEKKSLNDKAIFFNPVSYRKQLKGNFKFKLSERDLMSKRLLLFSHHIT